MSGNFYDDSTGSAISSIRATISQKNVPFFTGTGVANVTLALTVSIALGVVAVITDVTGYLILTDVTEKKINSETVADFAFIPVLGSAVFGTLALLVLIYSGAFSRMMNSENTQCMRGLMWAMVVTNFLVNTGLGFAGDHWLDHDRHAGLMEECMQSKLISLLILFVVGSATIGLGGEKFIIAQLCKFYEYTRDAVDNQIGPGTEFHDRGGYWGDMQGWCTMYCSSGRKGSDEPDAQTALLSNV